MKNKRNKKKGLFTSIRKPRSLRPGRPQGTKKGKRGFQRSESKRVERDARQDI